MQDKKQLRVKFAKKWKIHYELPVLKQLGFMRKICPKCGKGFWTLDEKRENCPDQPCQFYEFLSDPPTKKRFGYVESWKIIEKFFKKHGHTSIGRYPVVCRWRPDLFFTIASIIDFQRVEKHGVVFQMPANPLIVPQFCLRFNDIPNVGVTGKHYTNFCMIGQHSIYDGKEGYWKDKCVELDFRLLTRSFGIPEKEVVFVEDLWVGPGAFGPSMEYFVRGLELGNAVFTEFIETPSGVKEMENKVIDMGAGLERFAWITYGMPTSYDVVFDPVLKFLKNQLGIKYDLNFFFKYAKLAGTLNVDEVGDIRKARESLAKKLKVDVDELNKIVKPLESLYAICDHTKSLTFAIADGMLPSNVGGGYNLRVILRRALGFMEEFGWDIDLTKVCELHAKQLKPMCPELLEHISDINKILEIEKKRFKETKSRTERLVKVFSENGKELTEEKLIQLYDSDGITPELLKNVIPDLTVPENFYVKVTERHMGEKKAKIEEIVDVSGLPDTELLFYDNPKQTDFQAKVLKVIGDWVVLDKTLFYPEGGGQKPDMGFMENLMVVDVQKVGGVVIHKIIGKVKEGEIVNCRINSYRREILTKHHTATHIINTAARNVLGPWVWQHSAEKTSEKARLDITHYEALTDEEIEKIEDEANLIVNKNIPVKKEWMPREEAEKKYGFRIYQGGVVIGDKLRVVSIGDLDHEACGGLHCNSTGEVGFITISRAKRIQDGVVRIEFAAGPVALKQLRENEKLLKESADVLGVKEEDVPETVKKLFETWKEKRKQLKKRK